jgi:hypothetical protein
MWSIDLIKVSILFWINIGECSSKPRASIVCKIGNILFASGSQSTRQGAGDVLEANSQCVYYGLCHDRITCCDVSQILTRFCKHCFHFVLYKSNVWIFI